MLLFTRNTYLDHNATTPIAKEVRKAMERVMKKIPGNASSSTPMDGLRAVW